MDAGENFRIWDELNPDLLAMIFKKLSLDEVLIVLSRVCKSWRRAVLSPSCCWHEIEIEQWSQKYEWDFKTIERMLGLLISKTHGQVTKLSVYGLLSEESFLLIANHAQSLRSLRLPRSYLDDATTEEIAGKLSNITFLDLSSCYLLNARGLEAIGKHCQSLTTLLRNMDPPERESEPRYNEAFAMAATMPRLKHLEISFLWVETSGVVEIIRKCNELKLLNIRGCSRVKLDYAFVAEFPELKVVGAFPWEENPDRYLRLLWYHTDDEDVGEFDIEGWYFDPDN